MSDPTKAPTSSNNTRETEQDNTYVGLKLLASVLSYCVIYSLWFIINIHYPYTNETDGSWVARWMFSIIILLPLYISSIIMSIEYMGIAIYAPQTDLNVCRYRAAVGGVVGLFVGCMVLLTHEGWQDLVWHQRVFWVQFGFLHTAFVAAVVGRCWDGFMHRRHRRCAEKAELEAQEEFTKPGSKIVVAEVGAMV